MSHRPRILTADTPQWIEALRQLLEPHAEIVTADRMEPAVEHIRSGVDLIICGIHFAESRMFDLLRLAKADPATRGIPFLCIRYRDLGLTPAVFEGLQIACQALGAVAFVDFYDLKHKYGAAQADAHLQAIVLDLLENRGANDEDPA